MITRMENDDYVESKIVIKREPIIKREYEYEEQTSYRTLVSATNGMGLRHKLDEEELKKRQEEEENNEPFYKRARTSEENFQYVEQSRQAHEEKIRKLRIQEASENLVKNEPIESPDSNDIIFYNNPAYNFFNQRYNTNLPIIQYRDEIIQKLNENNIIIIQGNTGCGKTTQVPQYIIDDAAKNSRKCRIIVTQPRRLAAKSISRRVCEERGWAWGSVCGFKVSMENKFTDDTRIFYVTTGYLLEMIVANHAELSNYTHVILDEVHDRDLDTDLIILFLKLLLEKEFKGKVVLMSATLDPTLFVNYFQAVSNKNNVPTVKCEMNLFNVKEWYLDDLEEKLNYETGIKFKYDNPLIFDEQIEIVARLLRFIDEKEVKAMGASGETIAGLASIRGAALIFVPGMDEINRVKKYLQTNLADNQLVFCELHSEIALDYQMRAFDNTLDYHRKVIISTSIAESSITVPDVKYVIDFCLTKAPFTDPATNYTSLELIWASQSNLKQRLGRAGRVSQGICYRLIPKRFYQNALLEFPYPAIRRESIEKVILNIKRVCTDKPSKVIGLALTPPELDRIERTVLFLKEAGALSLYKKRKLCPDDGDLTYAGTIMVSLPVDIRLTKLILFGHVFGRLRDAVILAAGLSCKSIFISQPGSQFEFYKGKYFYSSGLMSDFTCILNAYNLWQAHQKYSNMSHRQMEKWCYDNLLDHRNLKELERIKNEIVTRLKRHGLKVEDDILDIRDTNFKNSQVMDSQTAIDELYILKFMIAGAFYPNYYKTSVNDEKEMVRMLNGKDPKSTVVVSSFQDYAIVYHEKIQEIFKICSPNLVLHYEGLKAFVEFKENYEVVNKIASGVYFALMLNKLEKPVELDRVYSKEYMAIKKDIDYLREYNSRRKGLGLTNRITTSNETVTDDVNLLLKNMTEFRIKPVVLTHLNYFWAHVDEQDYIDVLNQIENVLSRTNIMLEKCKKDDLFVGKLVVSFHFTGNATECGYYRAKITEIKEDRVKIIYVDYGNTEDKDFELIYECPSEISKIPNQAFRCELAHLRVDPFILEDHEKKSKALDEYSTLLYSIENLRARVYSVVDNVARVVLLDADNPLFMYDLANKLIKIEIFEKCQESYASELKHEERINMRFYEGLEGTKSQNEWIQIENIEKKIKKLHFNKDNRFSLRIMSPIEMRLMGMTKCLKFCKIKTDRQSINRIMLDQEPSLKCSSLVVAHRTADLDHKEIVLRNTCLFPKIKGLVSLVLLAFSPEVEFRYDKKSLKYTGALCGLGFDPIKRRPLYTENDVEEVFEVDFVDNDIKLLNSFRFLVNMLIGSKSSSESYLKNPEVLKNMQSKSRASILKLIAEKRNLKESPLHFNREFLWNQIPEDHLVSLNDDDRRMYESRKNDKTFYMPLRAVNFAKLKQQQRC